MHEWMAGRRTRQEQRKSETFGVHTHHLSFFPRLLAVTKPRVFSSILAFHYLYSLLMDKRITEVSHCKAQITTIIVDCVGMFNHNKCHLECVLGDLVHYHNQPIIGNICKLRTHSAASHTAHGPTGPTHTGHVRSPIIPLCCPIASHHILHPFHGSSRIGCCCFSSALARLMRLARCLLLLPHRRAITFLCWQHGELPSKVQTLEHPRVSARFRSLVRHIHWTCFGGMVALRVLLLLACVAALCALALGQSPEDESQDAPYNPPPPTSTPLLCSKYTRSPRSIDSKSANYTLPLSTNTTLVRAASSCAENL